jgi:hypothetical protein
MFSWSDLSTVFLLSVSLLGSSIIITGHFDKRHKRDLDFESKKINSESDTQLLKARIYADKDRDIARLESSVINSLSSDSSNYENDSMQQIMNLALQNPQLVNQFLEKIKK